MIQVLSDTLNVYFPLCYFIVFFFLRVMYLHIANLTCIIIEHFYFETIKLYTSSIIQDNLFFYSVTLNCDEFNYFLSRT